MFSFSCTLMMGQEGYFVPLCYKGKAMRVIRCPRCDELLPGYANYCAVCGAALVPSPVGTTARLASDAREFNASHFLTMDKQGQENIRFGEHGSTTETVRRGRWSARLTPNSTIPIVQERDNGDYTLDADGYGEDFWEFRPSGNWHKVVPSRTSHMPVQLPITPAPNSLPSPTQHLTPPAEAIILTPPPTGDKRRSPLLFVVSLLLLGAIITGGLIGVVVTLGRGALAQKSHATGITLQVSPANVALGAIITLRGSNFTPLGRIGLSRDSNIPIFDTANNNIIQADSKGSFADTVIVDAQWLSGTHLLRAEDAHLHKTATFTILVTGHSSSQRPAHLVFSSNALDLGSGDQATNSTKTITMTNAGGGQISWQTATTQPWLLLSPKSGTFSSGQSVQVTIAADRTNLSPGPYAAQAIFSTNVGQTSLPVSMQTTPLEVGHEPILQLTPAVLAFSGADGGNNPPAQVVTVSNPGALPLQWDATVSAGNSWLTVSPSSGTVGKGGSGSVVLGINSSAQLPGTYSAFVNFTTDGVPTRNSPQSIYVSLTIVPQCALQVSPGMLSFTGVELQPAPAAKVISLNVTQGCSTPLQWSATTTGSASWLSLGTTSGTTPSYPTVSVASASLQPGTYTAGIVFSTAAGTQTLPVTLTIGQPTTPLIATTPASMAFTAIVGQSNPAAQSMSVTNSGGGVLAWQAVASTTSGGSWLTLSSGSGTLAAYQSAPITIQPNLLTSLTPNTYTGIVTISGVDGSGNPANGGPQVIPVSFTVLPACTIAGAPAALTFAGVIGQPDPAAQTVTLSASGTCTHALNWTASIHGASWLNATPDSGTMSLSSPVSGSIGVSLAGLSPGTFTGRVVMTAVDSVTQRAVGTPQSITVTLTVQPPCTLQAPSVANITFNSEKGHNPKPATQSFSIGIIGACVGNVTITPTATQSWLTVSPSSAIITHGRATFTVKVASASLAAGSYSDTVSIAAVNSGGVTINGSVRTVGVALTVVAPPSLSVGQGTSGLTINDATGIITQALSINNGGGTPLNWKAKLGSNAPSFVTLSARGGSNLAGGNGIVDNVIANVTGVPGGSSFTTSVTITAIDPLTGNTVAGSPVVVPITINVAPPLMSLNTTALTYTTTAGVNPAAKSVVLTNAGGDGLTWTAGTPSQSWLTLGLTSGSDNANATSTVPFNVDVTGLASGSYTATVVITPSTGTAQTVTVNLTVN